jgi:hypothetical protein
MAKTASFDARDQPNGTTLPPRILECVVIVDPFSSGAVLAQRVVASGRYCVRVLSEFNSPVASLVSEHAAVQFDATVQHDDRGPDVNLAADETGRCDGACAPAAFA